MELPSELVAYVKEFLPPHPLKSEIDMWTRRTFFYKYYFQKQSSIKRKERIKRFVDHNDFWIKTTDLNNEEAVKLKHRCYLDKLRMKAKLNEMDLKPWQYRTITHIPILNKHGNFSEVFHNGQEVIY